MEEKNINENSKDTSLGFNEEDKIKEINEMAKLMQEGLEEIKKANTMMQSLDSVFAEVEWCSNTIRAMFFQIRTLEHILKERLNITADDLTKAQEKVIDQVLGKMKEAEHDAANDTKKENNEENIVEK